MNLFTFKSWFNFWVDFFKIPIHKHKTLGIGYFLSYDTLNELIQIWIMIHYLNWSAMNQNWLLYLHPALSLCRLTISNMKLKMCFWTLMHPWTLSKLTIWACLLLVLISQKVTWGRVYLFTYLNLYIESWFKLRNAYRMIKNWIMI